MFHTQIQTYTNLRFVKLLTHNVVKTKLNMIKKKGEGVLENSYLQK